MQIIGTIDKTIAEKINFKKLGDIYLSDGAINHIKRRHSNELSNEIIDNLTEIIKTIIKNPDMIGKHPNKENSIEFVKKIDYNLLVAIKLDIVNDYLYVSTLFPIRQSKIDRRLHSGRLKKIN